MFINKDSLVINNINMGKYISEVKFGYPKLWSSDTGRTLSGNMSGTLIGIFPKLTLQFRPLNKTEFETICGILDSASQSVTYYDPKKKQSVTINTYANDYEVTNKHVIDAYRRNEGFSCSFTSIKKRS